MEIAGKANDGIKYDQRILTPMEIAGKANGGNGLRPTEIDTHQIIRKGICK